MATASAIASTAPAALVLALLAALVLAALRVRIAFTAFATGIVAVRLVRRCGGILRLLRLLLATRATLPGLGTAFGSGTLAAIIRFVFGHGQSSLGAVGGTGGGKDQKGSGAEQRRLRAPGLR
jgi:hypothetical protein